MASMDFNGGAPLIGGGDREDIVVEGMLDYKGMKAVQSKTGGWRSAAYTIAVEVGERTAFYGISSNLITYLTGPLHQSTALAAVNVNAWSGVVSMLPLLGALVADSYLGRYRTILYSSVLHVMGLGMLTLSTLVPLSEFQVILFFSSLYIVAIAQSGHKPCAQAFAADQFNSQDPQESQSRSSFFNWWYFGICMGTLFCVPTLAYIQENFNWTLGFGLPCISMVSALIILVLGTKTYRYSVKDEKSPFIEIGLVFVVAAKNWKSTLAPSINMEKEATERSHLFKFLDKALIDVSDSQDYDSTKKRTICTIEQVNDAKSLLRLFPIWCTCLMYATVVAQVDTLFTKQGSTMDRLLGPSFQVPPASLLSVSSLSIVLFIPIYDRVIVPIARVFSNKPSGITMLQRVGFGIILSMITMVVAALVEKKRLKTAFDFGLIDNPGVTVPMSIWWLLPQYCLIGIADVFTRIGLQEFFYDQTPNGLKSLGIALYWSISGVGSFLSGFLISFTEKVSSNDGGDSWFSSNINQGHLDYFYWILTGFSAAAFVTYSYFARLYVYTRQNV